MKLYMSFSESFKTSSISDDANRPDNSDQVSSHPERERHRLSCLPCLACADVVVTWRGSAETGCGPAVIGRGPASQVVTDHYLEPCVGSIFIM